MLELTRCDQGVVCRDRHCRHRSAELVFIACRSQASSSDRLAFPFNVFYYDLGLGRQLEDTKKNSEKLIDTLKAVLEETDIRIADLKKEAYEFKRDIVVGAENMRTGNTMAEKVRLCFRSARCAKIFPRSGTNHQLHCLRREQESARYCICVTL